MFRRFVKSLAVLTASMIVYVFSAAQAETITVTDTLDRKIEIPANAERVLLGFYFEDFYAIGGADAFDKVVAISKDTWQGWRNSQWNAYVAVNPRIDTLIDIGEVDAGTFSIETAIAAKPDVAILAAWQYRALGEVVNKLEAAGIPVLVADYNAQTVEKHVTSTLMIGKVLGTEERAQKLADQYAKAVEEVNMRIAKLDASNFKNVYVELGNKSADEYGNSYGDTMWGGVIGLAGGKNIAIGKVSKWGPLNPEYILASNPKAVFIAGSDWTNKDKAVLMGFDTKPQITQDRLSPFAKRPGWDAMDAVKSGEVHALYHGGARTLYDFAFLQYIAKVLHPDAFADVDPVANHRKFYEAWLPIEANGAFMIKLDN